MEKGFVTDSVISIDDFAQQIMTDHDAVSARNTVLQNMVDKLIAELAKREEKILLLESALCFSEARRAGLGQPFATAIQDEILQKLEVLGRTEMEKAL
jgi:hypothetical protein